MISLRLSVSTSFMLAALRVLHTDTSHAPATGPSIEEWPLMAYQLPVRQGEDRSQRPSGLRRRWRDRDPAEHDPPYMPQASQVGGQVAVYDYYIGVVPAPKTPLRPAEPDRRSCAAGRSDERRHSAGYLAELDHRLGVPTVSLDAADARVVTGNESDAEGCHLPHNRHPHLDEKLGRDSIAQRLLNALRRRRQGFGSAC
jgi:hypothetical protein